MVKKISFLFFAIFLFFVGVVPVNAQEVDKETYPYYLKISDKYGAKEVYTNKPLVLSFSKISGSQTLHVSAFNSYGTMYYKDGQSYREFTLLGSSNIDFSYGSSTYEQIKILSSNYDVKDTQDNLLFHVPLLTESAFLPVREKVEEGTPIIVGLMTLLMALVVCLVLLVKHFRRLPMV